MNKEKALDRLQRKGFNSVVGAGWIRPSNDSENMRSRHLARLGQYTRKPNLRVNRAQATYVV